MLNKMGAGFVLRAYDSATPVIRRVGRAFGWLRGQTKRMAGGMNRSLGSMATGFMALHAGLGIVKLAKTAADAAGKFQQSLAAVGQISRATAEELLELRTAAIEAALGTKFSPDEAVAGLKTLAAQGLRAKESIQVLLPVLDLATGSLGQLGVAGAADAVVGTIKAMGYEMKDATRVTDQLLKITQMTNFQTKDFSTAMGRTASTARLYGQSLEDALITMGLIRNMNIEASVASTSLRESWRRLAADQRAQQAVQEKGVEIFDKGTGKIRSMLDIMTELVEKTKDLTDKERMRLTTIAFGVRGMAAFNAIANAQYTVMVKNEKVLLRGNNAINAMRYELSTTGDVLDQNQEAALRAALGISKLSDVLSTATRVAEEFKEKLLDTYEGQKQLIGGAWQTLMVVIGEDFAKSMKPAAAALYELISAMALFIKSLSPQAKQAIFKFVVALGALIALGGGLMLVSGVLNMLGGSVIGFVFSIGKLLLIGLPVLMILSGLGIGFTSLSKALNLFGKEGMSFTEIMTKVRLAASGAMSILSGEEFSKDLQKNLKKAENEGVVAFLKKFGKWVERFKTFWKGLKDGFQRGVEELAESSAFRRLQEKLEGLISIFTGPDAENTPEVLEEWGRRGETAGAKLATLGETAANMMGKLIDFGGKFAEFMGEITAEDIAKGIDGLVNSFDMLGDALNLIYGLFSGILNFIRLIVVGAIEAVMWIVNLLSAVVDLVNTPLGGFGEWSDKWGKALDPDRAFSWTKSAADALGESVRIGVQSPGAVMQTKGPGQLGPEGMESLRARKREIEEWTGASIEEWKKTAGGQAGNVPFADAPQAMQEKFLKELSTINENLKKYGEKKIQVNVNDEKVATSEDSLDEAPVMASF